jgi:hypothetical protein
MVMNANLLWFLLLFLVQYAVQIWAVIDLVGREKVHGKKWAWVLVIMLGELLGPIVYFIFGPKRD